MFSDETEILYPVDKISMDQFGKEEIRIAKSDAKAGSSFAELFKERLEKTPGKRETILYSYLLKLRKV